jgi:hypothetical protein
MIALHKETGKNVIKTSEALDLFTKLIKNVTENPNDEKFRSFKKVYRIIM